ncbi:MAG TPA: FAD-binding protein [Bauldia sp.]|nr:FAD-binding protein [Bauldia sp.]
MARTNWAGNITYNADRVVSPASVAEAQEIVRRAAKVRVLGSRHCFNPIADTEGVHLSFENLKGISVDRAKGQVTVAGGVTYGDLGPALYAEGYTLHNTASLPHISVAGATATATHGSGTALGSLATAVAALEFIDGSGNLVTLSRAGNPDTFPGAVVHLGALGAVTAITLDVKPAFAVRQDIYLDLPHARLEADFDRIMGSGYSVSLFTDWQHPAIEQLWVKSRVDPAVRWVAPDTFGARPAGRPMHPIMHLDAVHCTEQMGVAGPAYDRLPHFKVGSTPASGSELQVEYFVPLRHAVAAIRAVRAFGPRFAGLLMVSEVRTIAADDLWLSPFCSEACVAFHFSFEKDWPKLRQLLPDLEAGLMPFGVRPHWGKLFTMPAASVQSLYPKLPAFRALIEKHDPAGKFRNTFVDRYIFGQSGAGTSASGVPQPR